MGLIITVYLPNGEELWGYFRGNREDLKIQMGEQETGQNESEPKPTKLFLSSHTGEVVIPLELFEKCAYTIEPDSLG